MIYTLAAQAPRFALLALTAFAVWAGHPWWALFPLALVVIGPGCPKVR